MASADEVVRKLRQTATELEQAIPDLLLEQQITAKSLVQDRIQETGKDADGGQLGDYSTRKLPALFFLGTGAKATDNKLRKLAQEGKRISYKDFRKLDGKQNKHVDLTFKGQMWREIGLKKEGKEGKKVFVTIGPRTDRSEKVADFNTERYGNFLELSDDELEIITLDMADAVQDIVNNNLDGL